MKKLICIFAVLCLLLCSCGRADVKVRTDLSSANIMEFHTETKQPFTIDENGEYVIILNVSSGVFHISDDCYSASVIKEENRTILKTNDISRLIAAGYRPCGVCAKKYITEETHD